MGLFDVFHRNAVNDDIDDIYEDYEDSYPRKEEIPTSDGNVSPFQPVRSAADVQVNIVTPQRYEDASKIADLLRDMKIVLLNLTKMEQSAIRRILDFLSGAVYAEDADIMKVGTNVYIIAPYFVELNGDAHDPSGLGIRGIR